MFCHKLDSETENEEGEDDIAENKDDDEFDSEAEPASKQRRLNESAAESYNWSEQAPDRGGRRSSGHPNFSATTKNDGMNVETPVEAFRVLFDDVILDKIIIHTNEEIERVMSLLISEGHQYQSIHKKIDKEELCAFLGLCFYSAYFRENKFSVKDMWDDVFGRGIYRATLSEKRFEFLNRMLRFDHKNTRSERQATDKLAPIREIWDIFIQNCTNNYEPSNNCTIGEQLVSFRGRCLFSIYMKNKPERYGMKIFMLNDSETFYMLAAIPYVGKVEPTANDSVPAYFVKALVDQASLSGTWRTITMDNWFTSISLFETLERDYQLRAVGTIRKNKREIPSTLKAKSAVGSARFVFLDNLTLVSYTPRKNKKVLLLSSAHHTAAINNETRKPEIIMSYNSYKGATDTFDQKCRHFSTARRTQRWPLRFFYNMLDQSAVNAQVLYSLNADNPRLSRNNFLQKLAFGLVEPHLRRRLGIATIRASIKKIISKLLEIDEPVPAVMSVIKEDTRAKCGMCESDAPGRTRMKCPNCLRRMCDNHRAAICVECECFAEN